MLAKVTILLKKTLNFKYFTIFTKFNDIRVLGVFLKSHAAFGVARCCFSAWSSAFPVFEFI